MVKFLIRENEKVLGEKYYLIGEGHAAVILTKVRPNTFDEV